MQQTSVGAVGTPVTGKGGGGDGGGGGGSSARLHHHWWGHGHGHAHAQDAAQGSMNRWRASMEAEMQRVKQLPSSSNYAAHRIRVLGKAMQLLSIVPETRSSLSEPEELELLFSSVSL